MQPSIANKSERRVEGHMQQLQLQVMHTSRCVFHGAALHNNDERIYV